MSAPAPKTTAVPQRGVSFMSFCDRVLGLKLTCGQSAFARVAFDGQAFASLAPEERAAAVALFGGDLGDVSELARRLVYLRAGRDSGKTMLAIARSIHLLLTNPLVGVGRSDRACAIITTPGVDFAKACAQQAIRMVEKVESISMLLTSKTKMGFVLRRPDGFEVELVAVAKSRGGAAARGRSIVVGMLDESEYFPSGQNENNPVSDTDIINAMTPRIVSGGQLILTSTPWPAPSASSDIYDRNFGAPSFALAACGPTPLMRDFSPLAMAKIAAERERDPANVEREYFCVPGASGASFFDPATIASAVSLSPPPSVAGSSPRTSAACDLAFKTDPSVLVVLQRQYVDNKDKLVVIHIDERRPRPGAPLIPSQVCTDYAVSAKGFGAQLLAGDVHYYESLREHAAKASIPVIAGPGGASGKLESFTLVRELLREGTLVLPNHAELLWQLRSVMRRATPGGEMSIINPRRSGAHGDIVSALVLAAWLDRRQHGAVGGNYAIKDEDFFFGGSWSFTPLFGG